MIKITKDIRNLPLDTGLWPLDVPSLYTNIPHSEGILVTSEPLAVHRGQYNLPLNSCITDLLTALLENSNLDYSGEYYHQKAGTAIGPKLAPSYPNTIMSHFEEKYVYHHHNEPLLCKRFTDLFLNWTHGMDKLMPFTTHLNQIPLSNSFLKHYTHKCNSQIVWSI